ncbi:hypothetical protein QZH41_014556, partial [Actinostola sp. cb2023]
KSDLQKQVMLSSGEILCKRKNIALQLKLREVGGLAQHRFSLGEKARASSNYLPNTMETKGRYRQKAFCGTYSHDGTVFLSACQDEYIRLYDTTNGQFYNFHSIKARDIGWSIIDTAYSPDQNYLIYSSWSDYIHLCNIYGDYNTHIALDLKPRGRRFCAFSIEFSQDNTEIIAGEAFLIIIIISVIIICVIIISVIICVIIISVIIICVFIISVIICVFIISVIICVIIISVIIFVVIICVVIISVIICVVIISVIICVFIISVIICVVIISVIIICVVIISIIICVFIISVIICVVIISVIICVVIISVIICVVIISVIICVVIISVIIICVVIISVIICVVIISVIICVVIISVIIICVVIISVIIFIICVFIISVIICVVIISVIICVVIISVIICVIISIIICVVIICVIICVVIISVIICVVIICVIICVVIISVIICVVIISVIIICVVIISGIICVVIILVIIICVIIIFILGHDQDYDVNAVTFADASSQILFSGGDDGLCKVWDRRMLNESGPVPVGVFAGHSDGVTFIHSKNDSHHLITNCKDQTIKLWDLRRFSTKEGIDNTKRAVESQHWDYRWQNVPKRILRAKTIPGDSSIMTYRGHNVRNTLIRCYFSPVHTTGQVC